MVAIEVKLFNPSGWASKAVIKEVLFMRLGWAAETNEYCLLDVQADEVLMSDIVLHRQTIRK